MPDSLILKKEPFGYSIPFFESKGAKAFFTTKPLDFRFGHPRRKQMFASLPVAAGRFVCLDQVHGTRVALAGCNKAGAGTRARTNAIEATDALVTPDKNLFISVLTADCLPVFMLDTHKNTAAVVHAGWKGLKKDILSKTIRQMKHCLKSRAEDLWVVLGPCIRSCCYRVGPEFLEHFPGFVRSANGEFFMDLACRAAAEMQDQGVKKSRIFDTGLCTCCREDFHSFRREGAGAGRCLSAIGLY